jgi:hypothetical protein
VRLPQDNSSGSIAFNTAGGHASFFGELVMEGDASAFVMALTKAPADLSGTDGLAVRIRGDGQTYKLVTRTVRSACCGVDERDAAQTNTILMCWDGGCLPHRRQPKE